MNTLMLHGLQGASLGEWQVSNQTCARDSSCSYTCAFITMNANVCKIAMLGLRVWFCVILCSVFCYVPCNFIVSLGIVKVCMLSC